MEIKEFRIGSIVELLRPTQLPGISRGLTFTQISSLDEGSINGSDKKYFEPVLIDEYRLSKCHFVADRDMDKITNFMLDIKNVDANKFDVYYNDERVYQNATYIHEVQNLHMYYSKQELDVDGLI